MYEMLMQVERLGNVIPFAETRMLLLPISSLLITTPLRGIATVGKRLNVRHFNHQVIEKRAIIRDWKEIVCYIQIFCSGVQGEFG